MTASGDAEAAARQAADSDWLVRAARVGFVAKGLIYVLIGLLAVQVALGDSQQADQDGALRAVSGTPGGVVVLWAMVAGFLGYAGWRLGQAAFGRYEETDERTRTIKRIGSALNALAYLAFAVLVLRLLLTSSSGGGSASLTGRVLEWPGGQAIVVTAGLVVLGIAVGLTWRGLSTDFDKHLDKGKLSAGAFSMLSRLGQVGYVARGLVIGLVGVLVVKAAIEHEPGQAKGLDVAIKSLAQAPFGQVLLIVVAVGLVCFGAYCLAEARYRRL